MVCIITSAVVTLSSSPDFLLKLILKSYSVASRLDKPVSNEIDAQLGADAKVGKVKTKQIAMDKKRELVRITDSFSGEYSF